MGKFCYLRPTALLIRSVIDRQSLSLSCSTLERNVVGKLYPYRSDSNAALISSVSIDFPFHQDTHTTTNQLCNREELVYKFYFKLRTLTNIDLRFLSALGQPLQKNLVSCIFEYKNWQPYMWPSGKALIREDE